MREEFIKNTINGFSRFYEYGVIELADPENLASKWALVKILDANTKKVIMFINSTKPIDSEGILSELKEILNCESVQLIKVCLLDNNEGSPEHIELSYEEDAVTIDINSGRLLAYGYKAEETAQELVSLMEHYRSRRYESKSENGKPWVTYGIILINIIVYIITALLSGDIFDSDINVLVFLGAKYNEAIVQGEYYRLVACMFLHGGILHLVLNMYALNSVGPLVESVYGKLKFLVIYVLSGIVSSLLSFLFSEGISIGASGAIFGLLGTTLVYAITMRRNIGKGFLRNIASVITINLFIGFSMPNIDNFGHLGGLIGGVITAFILNLIRKK
jgi:rhomboid protease GluP